MSAKAERIYLKYASDPVGRLREYQFTFTKTHLDEVEEIAVKAPKTFIPLVCVKDREICCLSAAQLRMLVKQRSDGQGRGRGHLYDHRVVAEGQAVPRVRQLPRVAIPGPSVGFGKEPR